MIVPLFDAHLDLAWSAVGFDRDLTSEVTSIRIAETGLTDEPARTRNTVSLPELRKAGVRVCVATLLARAGPERRDRSTPLKRADLDSVSPALAYAAGHEQLAWYRLMERQGFIRILRTAGDLKAHWEQAGTDAQTPLGVILSMEGTDPIISPDQAREWWDAGLRAAGLAHYGRGRYAYGTGVVGPLSDEGLALLREFSRLGMILDVTHLCDASMAESLDAFDGPVLASHHNCRALVPGDRQLTDEQIVRLTKRGAVIGAALDAWMLYPGWVRGRTLPEVVGLDAVADHIDRVCQLAGDARHAGIGSDLDGGFGIEQTPRDLNTIADLQKLAEILASRGYARAAVDAIFHGNWLRLFSQALPS